MNTSQLACFLTVAETLNFAMAAERLHVTQPAVTQQIRSLEDKSALDVYLCDSGEASAALAQAGFGAAIVPGLAPSGGPELRYLRILDAEPMSYGVYYKSLTGRPELREFIELSGEQFQV